MRAPRLQVNEGTVNEGTGSLTTNGEYPHVSEVVWHILVGGGAGGGGAIAIVCPK
jgi:hypothetical protein